MIAAASTVAAMEGLQMRMVGNTTMSQKLTEQLAQTIRSDPVGTSVNDLIGTHHSHTISDFQTNLDSHSSGLSQGLSGTNRVAAGNQSQTGTAAATLSYHGNEAHRRGAGPLDYTHRCPGHKHLMECCQSCCWMRTEKQVELIKWTAILDTHKYKHTHGFVLHDVVRVLEHSQVTQQCIRTVSVRSSMNCGRYQREMLTGHYHVQDIDSLRQGFS